MHGLTLDDLHCRIHVADKLTRSRACWMHSDTYYRALQCLALLGFGTGSTFRPAVLVAVHRFYQALIGLNHRVGNLFIELLDDVLTSSRVTDDEHAVVQSADDFRLIPEMVIGPSHQRSEQRRATKEYCRHLVRVCIQEQLLHTRIVFCHFL